MYHIPNTNVATFQPHSPISKQATKCYNPMAMPLKNYTSEVPVERTLQNILAILNKNGADKVTIEYASGNPSAVTFTIKTEKGMLPVKLPARIENVERLIYSQKKPRYSWQEQEPLTEKEKAQVRRTAWKNIYDWIAAQLALVETSMVKIEEVFLPYMQDREGITFFEHMEERSFLLGDGKQAA
ncbi:MAG TPA: hypothetical protein VEP90_22960 [Methylomirabilota bacterium]|nr:hypothetical protein [Methylomirabilota bacterium]